MKSMLSQIILIIMICGIVLGIYSVFIEPFRLRVTEWKIVSDKLAPGQSIRIALIADPHMAWPWMSMSRVRSIAAKANALDPDIMLLLGDYVGTHPFKFPINPAEGAEALKDFKARCGVYAIFGNHDFDKRAPEWDTSVRGTGIAVLENRAIKTECNGMPFWIAGLKDQWFQDADLPGTLAQINDEVPVILMMHEPDLFPETPSSVALTVAGHTHGGQVALPFIGPLLVPSKYGTRYAYGHIVEDGKNLVVSGGLGVSILPVRFGVIPEITLVTLTAAKQIT